MECPVKDKRAAGEKVSECPVGGSSAASGARATLGSSWLGTWFSPSAPASSPNDTNASKDASSRASACPIPGVVTDKAVPGTGAGAGAGSSAKVVGLTEAYNQPANDLVFNQEKHPDQSVSFSTKRIVSGIPKSDFTPAHQPKEAVNEGGQKLDRWVYPSEQQYYNAMKKKGYNPPEKDIGAILAIHNHVNESSWEKILEWEAFRGCTSPQLKRFEGRPKDLSPKAQIMSWFGIAPPFDRHDWFVERLGGDSGSGSGSGEGKIVRYVIDFYHVPNRPGLPVHLDVRPALDSPQAFMDRIEMGFRQRFWPQSLTAIKAVTKRQGQGQGLGGPGTEAGAGESGSPHAKAIP